MPPVPLWIEAAAGVVTIRLTGEVDVAVVDDLRSRVAVSSLVRIARILTVDLSAVEFLDVVALNLLLEWRNQTVRRGAEFRVSNPPRQPHRLIVRAGLQDALLGGAQR